MSLLITLFAANFMLAQAPSGYYDAAKGKNKGELLKALESIVGKHTDVGYGGLYDVYQTSDVTAEGYIWDMYATTKYSPGTGDRCGNYSSIGDCYNREHSFPKSWFNNASPMVSDAYHIYPTDGKVNGQRSNYPYGECANGTSVASKGDIRALGKLGTSTFPGYKGKVFEPDDQYKGDFARTYFYMVAAYNSRVSSWSSEHLDGTSYPAFTTWTINLLLKWSRQDPVSQKEIDRNNAVSKWQHNRNPFIDYPELAEYIWGNRTDMGWTPGGTTQPSIVLPTDNSAVNMGVTGTNVEIATSIKVKTVDVTKPLAVSIAGSNAFSVSSTTIAASAANAGTTITVKYNSAVVGKSSAVLTISNDEVTSKVTLNAEATDGIPANAATDITTSSFTAHWIDVDFSGNYSLNVMESDKQTSVSGYPVQVATSKQSYTVSGLQADTDYFYQLTGNNGRHSDIIAVHTAAPEKILAFELPQGGLKFTAKPNAVSEILEAKVFTDYITEPVTVTISDDFEISLDKSNWTQTLIIDPEGENIFVRMKAHNKVGEYNGVISLDTPTFEGEDAAVSGTVAIPVTFFEDFEAPTAEGYASTDYEGTACVWKRSSVGIYGRNGSDKFNGTHAACTGKSGSRSLLMGEDKPYGAGTVSFYAAPFGSDAAGVIDLVYSVDGGQTWKPIAESITIEKGDLKMYNYKADIAGNVRIGFKQISGKRLNIDDISITDYKSVGIADIAADGWDVYSSGAGQLVIDTRNEQRIEIYSFDATKVYDAVPAVGKSIIELPQGIYIVVSGNASKKIIVK